MSPELEKQLVEKYPILFRDRNKSPQETCMCWGTEFGDGWYKIFEYLCSYLTILSGQEIMVKVKKKYTTEENRGYQFISSPTVSFTQTKEKYGTMRIYWMGNGIENYEQIKEKLDNESLQTLEATVKRFYDRVDYVIDYAEFLSSKVCEECGEPGKLYTNGWYMTKCKKHIVEHYGFDPDEEEQKQF